MTTHSPLAWIEVTAALSNPEALSAVLSSAGTADSSLSGILPYSIIVTNNGAVPLIGIDLRYTVNLGSRTVYRNFFYHAFGSAAQPILGVGQSRLFTPLNAVNLAVATANPAMSSANSSQHDIAVIRDLSAANGVDASVDLVIAADGRTTGPDKAGTLNKLQQTVDVYSSMRDEYLGRTANNDSDDSIQQWLSALAQQQVFRDSQTGTSDRISGEQKQLATEWLAYVSTGRGSDLLAILNSQPPQVAFAYVLALKGGLQ